MRLDKQAVLQLSGQVPCCTWLQAPDALESLQRMHQHHTKHYTKTSAVMLTTD